MRLLLLSIVLIACSCATTRFVEPLEKDEIAVGINAGGPILVFAGSTIPLPLSGIYAGYGYKENLTIYGSLHTTSLLFKTLQLEAGVRRNIFEGSGISPSISSGFAINGITDFREYNVRIYPEVSINPYWKYGKWKTYTGTQIWFDIYKLGQQNYGYNGFFVPSIHLGQSIDLGTWNISLEYKRLGFNIPTENSVVNYITFGGIGAQGVYLSAHKTFGYNKKEEIE